MDTAVRQFVNRRFANGIETVINLVRISTNYSLFSRLAFHYILAISDGYHSKAVRKSTIANEMATSYTTLFVFRRNTASFQGWPLPYILAISDGYHSEAVRKSTICKWDRNSYQPCSYFDEIQPLFKAGLLLTY